jgi:hypothetical protein
MQSTVCETVPTHGAVRPSRWSDVRSWTRSRRLDIAALVGLFAGFFAVNDVRHWVTAPYWLDESWVALSTRVPVGDLPTITSTTPIGWTVLLRTVPDPDALRLVPLVFALLTIPAAYAFGRLLPWRGHLEAVVAGGLSASAVVLLPAAQDRHDLKQYTADAALTLALLVLTQRTDRSGQRRDVVLLAAAGPAAFLFSSVALIASAAAFGGLVVAAAARRQWRAVRERVVAGAAAGAVLLVLYIVLIARVRVPALAAFWADYYPGPAQLPAYLHDQMRILAPSLGFGRWWVWFLFVLGGLAVLVAMRATAMAGALTLLPVLLAVLGVAKAYPLLEARTSFFLLTVAAAVTGVAVAGVASVLARWAAPRRPTLAPVLTVVLALVAIGGFGAVNHASFRQQNPAVIRYTDVRTQTRWVDANRRPGDVVLLSFNARYGYLFYHDDQPLHWHPSDRFAHGWDAVMPPDADLVTSDGLTPEYIQRAVDEAVAQARANGPQARVLIVRSFWFFAGEPDAWQAALAPYQVSYPYTGVEPVAVIEHP